MDDEELSEPARRNVAFKRQLQCCSGVLLASLVTGMSWVLSLHNSYLYKHIINDTIYSNAPTWVAITSVITAAFSTHFLGRKKTIIGMQVLYVVPLLVTAGTENPLVQYACALVNKFGRDMLVVVLTLYTSEVSQARARAFFVGLYYLAFYVGVTVARFLPDTFKIVLALLIMLDAAGLGLTIMAPETPHYLAMTDRADEAREVLRLLWLDAGEEEASDGEANALLERADFYADEFREGIFPILTSTRFVVPLVLCFSYTLANYHICHLFYKPTRYAAEAQGYAYMELLFTDVIADITVKKFLTDIFHILGCGLYMAVCFVFSRRTLVFFSLLSSLAYGFTFVLAPLGPKVLLMVYSCTMFERMGLRQTAQILPTEIFPAVTRDVGVCVSYLIHYMIYNQLNFMSIHKPYGPREIVSIILFICFPMGIIVIYLFMPETKDLPLTQTEELGEKFVFQPALYSVAPDEETYTDE